MILYFLFYNFGLKNLNKFVRKKYNLSFYHYCIGEQIVCQNLFSHLSLNESSFYFSDQPFEGLLRQVKLFDDTFGTEGWTHEDVHQQCGVYVRLSTEAILAFHDQESLAQIPHPFYDFQRMQVCWLSFVDTENFLSVPNQTLQVARQHNLR